ncbi:MAG TPA: hypothetical protein VL049_01690 [Candidatus Dormibacteraeota bacterium]|nr:hypothetical protein [Candidatus Dormibacteraeota bacterium]
MANGTRGSVVDAPRPAATRRTLRSDPTLPRALVDLVFATGDAGTARRPRRRLGDAPSRPLPRRLPSAIATEIPPNILYRRYPLVTSLLVELDELRRVGAVPPIRRGR